jgi:predicted RNase H-like nuclease (RuvC/YqgF family)
LNDKITKIRTDFKNLKKENQNLKDSNENHIFINEKLNQALKKATARIEDLEKKLSSNDSGSGLAVSNSKGEDSD